MIALAAVQLVLELPPGPPAATPPPCACCHGLRWMPCVGGWAPCTWCEGSGVDPELRGLVRAS